MAEQIKNLPEYAEKISALRKAKGYTQGELAYACGVKVDAISQYERGRRKPNSRVMPRLARALDCSIEDIFDGNTKIRQKPIRIVKGGSVDTIKPMRKLKALRKMKGYTQGELAYMIGADTSAISQYESGQRAPNIATMAKLAKTLGCRISDINEYE